jgi:hypothetical protein
VSALMKAEREQQQNKLEDRNDKPSIQQSNSPQTGKLRVAW